MGNKKITNYYYITIGSFPYGSASTNRVLSYTRGLIEIGNKVVINVLAPDKKQDFNSNQKRSIYKGVEIVYSCPFLFIKSSFYRKINFIVGLIVGFFMIFYNIIRKRKKSVVVFLFTNPILILLFLIPAKILGVRSFHERTEFPFLNIKNSLLFKIYIKVTIPKLDGVYVISHSLREYFKSLTQKPVLLLPMTVELDRFAGLENRKKGKYIAYCGSMYTYKDGVPDLIDAFNHFAVTHPDYSLYLIGDNTDTRKFQLIQNKINKSPFRNKIICTGYISRNNIPSILNKATVLALCRPANKQAEGGFPTKLGEYLATGNPVVITDVGDHTKYLKHKISAYIAKPENSIDFADKLIDCISNPNLSKSIGREGYKVAMKHFNYRNQAIMLEKFVNY